MACNGAPSITSGGNPALDVTVAPIRVNGSIIRRIGRRRRD